MSHGAVSPSFGRFQSVQVVRRDGAVTHHTAFDPKLERQVALITAPPGPDRAEEDRLAFRLPRMRHPNIVSVLDAGLEDDVAFVAAECLQTEPLAEFVARPGRMPFFQGLPLVLQLLSAIEHAQARRLVHSGIDQDHVQVTPGGQPKLPAAGWSLSADRQPNLEDAARIARSVLSRSCPPALRGALEQVLLRAEAPDRAARYPRADEFILDLLAAAGFPVGRSISAPVELRPTAEPQRPEPVAPAVRVVPVEPVRVAESPKPIAPVEPILVVEPDEPIAPVEPTLHAEPMQHLEPTLLAEPDEQIEAAEPVLLAEPMEPVEPTLLAEPIAEQLEPALLAEAEEPAELAAPIAPILHAAAVEQLEPTLLSEPVAPEPVAPFLAAEPMEQQLEPTLLAEPVAAIEPVAPALRAEPMEPVEPVLLPEPMEPMQRIEPVLHANALPARAVRHAPRRAHQRRRTSHHVLAACLLAALFLPGWVGERVFDGSPGTQRSSATVTLGAAPARVEPAALVQPAAVKVAPAPAAPAAASPTTVALASMTAPPVHTPAAVQPAPVETPPLLTPRVEPSAAEPAPVAPSRAPSAAAPSAAPPVAVAPQETAPKDVARPAVRHHPVRARQFASAEAVRAKPGSMHGRSARPQRARVVTAASGCPFELPVFRELCEARQCSRPDLRNDPTCVRMRSEQRAALARLRGTPD